MKNVDRESSGLTLLTRENKLFRQTKSTRTSRRAKELMYSVALLVSATARNPGDRPHSTTYGSLDHLSRAAQADNARYQPTAASWLNALLFCTGETFSHGDVAWRRSAPTPALWHSKPPAP